MFFAKTSIRLQGAASDSGSGEECVLKKKKQTHVYEPGFFLNPKNSDPKAHMAPRVPDKGL